MPRREKHFQDTEERQQDRKKKKGKWILKGSLKENLRDQKGIAFPKKKKKKIYIYKYIWDPRFF